MLDKIKQWLNTLLEKVPELEVAKGNVWIVHLALLLLFGSIVLYIGTWIWMCFWLGKAGLAELEKIIYIMCGAPFIAALCYLSKSAVDTDGDGISDNLMEEKERCHRNA